MVRLKKTARPAAAERSPGEEKENESPQTQVPTALSRPSDLPAEQVDDELMSSESSSDSSSSEEEDEGSPEVLDTEVELDDEDEEEDDEADEDEEEEDEEEAAAKRRDAAGWSEHPNAICARQEDAVKFRLLLARFLDLERPIVTTRMLA